MFSKLHKSSREIYQTNFEDWINYYNHIAVISSNLSIYIIPWISLRTVHINPTLYSSLGAWGLFLPLLSTLQPAYKLYQEPFIGHWIHSSSGEPIQNFLAEQWSFKVDREVGEGWLQLPQGRKGYIQCYIMKFKLSWVHERKCQRANHLSNMLMLKLLKYSYIVRNKTKDTCKGYSSDIIFVMLLL